MIECSQRDGDLTFRVKVVPRASRSEIAGEQAGALRIRLAAAPVDGAANDELITTLARLLQISRTAVDITSGYSSRIKCVRIKGATPGDLERLLQTRTIRTGSDNDRLGPLNDKREPAGPKLP